MDFLEMLLFFNMIEEDEPTPQPIYNTSYTYDDDCYYDDEGYFDEDDDEYYFW